MLRLQVLLLFQIICTFIIGVLGNKLAEIVKLSPYTLFLSIFIFIGLAFLIETSIRKAGTASIEPLKEKPSVRNISKNNFGRLSRLIHLTRNRLILKVSEQGKVTPIKWSDNAMLALCFSFSLFTFIFHAYCYVFIYSLSGDLWDVIYVVFFILVESGCCVLAERRYNKSGFKYKLEQELNTLSVILLSGVMFWMLFFSIPLLKFTNGNWYMLISGIVGAIIGYSLYRMYLHDQK